MKLLSVYIDNYKNLSGTYDFTKQDGYIALIGENGSGKSNLLEAISLIYGKLYNISNIANIGKFRICYNLDETDYTYGNIDEDNNDIELDANPKLPSSVISCYSGEDMRMWGSVYKSYYTDFFNKAIQGGSYIPKMLYINKYSWKIALISLLYSENREVKDFLSNKLGINEEDVKIKFTRKTQEIERNHDASNWYKEVENKLGNGEFMISALKEIDLNETQDVYVTVDQRIFYYLYFLSMPEKNPKIGLNADKLIEDISIKINDNISFDNLSEGEKKLILIECITKVLGDKDSLLLFDEPDAHTHIARKKELLSAIETFEGQVILTTHSPVFVNQMTDINIYPMINGKVLTQEKRELIPKIANNEINIIDSACIVSSKYVLITEGPDDIFHIKSAISANISKNDKFQKLKNISYLFMGGAKEVNNYYDEILKYMYNTVSKIIFAFDYDEEGREGAKMVEKLIENGNDKLQYVFYHKIYPVPVPDIDFYLEDFFERDSYNDVQLPNFSIPPTFAELKKASTWANSIKKRIQKHKRDNSLTPDDYKGFDSFLNQLIIAFDS